MGGAESEERMEQQFAVGDAASLTLDTVSGRVNIRPSSTASVRIEARKYGRARAVENTQVEIVQDGDAITVRTKFEPGSFFGESGPCAVDFDISVPAWCRLDLQTVSAAVAIGEIEGAVRVETVSGSVAVGAAAQSCTVSTVSGDFTGRRLSGALRRTAVSGRTDVFGSRLNECEVESVSGRIELESPLSPSGRYSMKTVSGEMRLRVPADTGATVTLRSVSGRLQSGLPSTVEKIGFGSWRGAINAGGTQLDFESVSGNVEIVASAATAPVPESTPVQV